MEAERKEQEAETQSEDTDDLSVADMVQGIQRIEDGLMLNVPSAKRRRLQPIYEPLPPPQRSQSNNANDYS